MRDKKDQISRFHVKVKKFSEYAKANNIDPSKMHEQLSSEELEQFKGEPMRFPTGFMPMLEKHGCFNCGKETCYLDKTLGLYMCSEECRDVIDAKYNAGEDFEPHPVYIGLCESEYKDFKN